MKLNPKSFGLSCGIFWSVGLVAMTILNLIPFFRGFAGELLLIVQGFYPGYTISVIGIFIGAIYGFIDGFVGGWVFAWLYNRFSKE